MAIFNEMFGGKDPLEKAAGGSIEKSAAISLKRIADALERANEIAAAHTKQVREASYRGGG